VVRGGGLRATGYVLSNGLAAVASVFLLRYLGVEDFGRYVTVTALVGIVNGITEAGLSVVGAREMARQPPGPSRRHIVQNVLALRLGLSVLGVAGAVLFAAAAGYDRTQVVGTALAGVGLILINFQGSMLLPLIVELRNATLTLNDVIKQLLTIGGIVLLVLVSASLVSFFALQIVVGTVILALTPLVAGRATMVLPRVDRAAALELVRKALPVAIGFVLGILYFRVLMVEMSLLANAHEVGLFATSFRIVEVLVGIPLMASTVVLPVTVAAAQDGAQRLRYVLRRVTEVAFAVGLGIVVVITIVDEPIIVLLGGEQYRDAAPILSIQSISLVSIFLIQGWVTGLLALERQRALIWTSAAGLLAAVVLGLLLIPAFEGIGGAVAVVVADWLLALLTYVALRRSGPSRFFRPGFVLRVLAIAVAARAVGSVPGVPEIVLGAAAAGIFATGLWAMGLVPPEVVDAARLSRLRRGRDPRPLS
jgi:O-antigen/teichoic acid export membrane protein